MAVVLDHDKQRLTDEQRARDNRVVSEHHGEAPAKSGYRFGSHPCTRGPLRGPDPPFQGGSQVWKPPEADSSGPAKARAAVQAPHGAYYHPAHELRSMRSAPSLYATGAAVTDTGVGVKSVIDTSELTHPLSVELNRWKKFAEFSAKSEMKNSVRLTRSKPPAEPPKPRAHVDGLVNFPKYMLIHNCHLKQQDQIRYVEEETAKRKAAEEAMLQRMEMEDEGEMFEPPGARESGMTQASQASAADSMLKKVASWGQPVRFRTSEERNKHWAGNPLPQGRGSRTSNPYMLG